jgi:hypothetical protein
MDRRVWQFRRTPGNLLFVGVVLDGISLPITWSALPKHAVRPVESSGRSLMSRGGGKSEERRVRNEERRTRSGE